MPRPPRPRRILAGLALPLALVAACTGGEGSGPAEPTPSAAEPTPLGDYEVAGLALARASACPALDDEAVARALGGEVTDSTSYSSGEPATLAVGVRDVAHEAGCVFSGEEGTTARAWTFAPPVSPPRAKAVVRTLAQEEGCTRVQDAPAFGKPGLGRTCSRGRRLVGSYGGLFGDAWVGCSVAVPTSAARGPKGRRSLVRRTGEWCVQVLEAARRTTEASEEASGAESGS